MDVDGLELDWMWTSFLGILYILSQITGAMMGALILANLVPGASVQTLGLGQSCIGSVMNHWLYGSGCHLVTLEAGLLAF